MRCPWKQQLFIRLSFPKTQCLLYLEYLNHSYLSNRCNIKAKVISWGWTLIKGKMLIKTLVRCIITTQCTRDIKISTHQLDWCPANSNNTLSNITKLLVRTFQSKWGLMEWIKVTTQLFQKTLDTHNNMVIQVEHLETCSRIIMLISKDTSMSDFDLMTFKLL